MSSAAWVLCWSCAVTMSELSRSTWMASSVRLAMATCPIPQAFLSAWQPSLQSVGSPNVPLGSWVHRKASAAEFELSFLSTRNRDVLALALSGLDATLAEAKLAASRAEGSALDAAQMFEDAHAILITDQYAQSVASLGPGAPFRLTPRELEVLHLIADGRSDAEMGEPYSSAARTVTSIPPASSKSWGDRTYRGCRLGNTPGKSSRARCSGPDYSYRSPYLVRCSVPFVLLIMEPVPGGTAYASSSRSVHPGNRRWAVMRKVLSAFLTLALAIGSVGTLAGMASLRDRGAVGFGSPLAVHAVRPITPPSITTSQPATSKPSTKMVGVAGGSGASDHSRLGTRSRHCYPPCGKPIRKCASPSTILLR